MLGDDLVQVEARLPAPLELCPRRFQDLDAAPATEWDSEEENAFCYAIMLPGRKTVFRAGFRPAEIRPGRSISGPETIFRKIG